MGQTSNSLESIIQLPGSFDPSIHSIYWVANTPSSLYNMMKENFFIRETLSSIESNSLIKAFEHRTGLQITNSSEIAELYGILIALSYKPFNEVSDFFENVGKTIKYEWFSKISELIIEQYKNSAHITYSDFRNEFGQSSNKDAYYLNS